MKAVRIEVRARAGTDSNIRSEHEDRIRELTARVEAERKQLDRRAGALPLSALHDELFPTETPGRYCPRCGTSLLDPYSGTYEEWCDECKWNTEE